VRSLISALARKTTACHAELSPQELGNALYGLQGMSSEWPEVRDVVIALTRRAETLRDPLSEQAVGMALYGLQAMPDECEAVRTLVTVLARLSEDDRHEASREYGPATTSPKESRRHSRHEANPLAERWCEPKVLPPDLMDTMFPSDNGLLVDIGSNKGGFARSVAEARPEINVLGLELRPVAVTYAAECARRRGIGNVVFLQANANVDLDAILRQVHARSTEALQTVTINFPDPHFQSGRWERRVTSGPLVATLARYMAIGKDVLFQSDVEELVDEARAGFLAGGAFELGEWSQWLPPTERELAVRRKQGVVHRARFVRTAISVASRGLVAWGANVPNLAPMVDGVLANLRVNYAEAERALTLE